MSGLAKKQQSKYADRVATQVDSASYEGDKAITKSDYEQLVSLLLTSFNESKFYESADEQELRLQYIVEHMCDSKEDTLFALKACIYARTVGNIRTMPLMTLAVIAENLKGVDNQAVVYRAVRQALTRVDDAITICAYAKMRYGRIPKHVRRAVADFLDEQNEYKLAKYQRRKHNFKLKDVLILCRPQKYRDTLYKDIIENNLRNKETWESKLSAGEDKSEVFAAMVKEGKLPYMAMLRNINNMSGLDDATFDKAMAKLSDEESVKSSKQLPFRFMSAYKAIAQKSVDDYVDFAFVPSRFTTGKAKKKQHMIDQRRLDKVATALSKAMEIQVEQYDMFTDDDKVAILVDTSGSMYSYVSAKSTIMMAEIGLALGAMLATRLPDGNVKVYAWATNTYDITGEITDPAIPLVKRVAKKDYSRMTESGTNIDQALNRVYEDNFGKKVFTKVIILSDMQVAYYANNRAWERYPDETHFYMIDLQGYTTKTQIDQMEPNVTEISGFSDAIFTTIEGTKEEADVAATIADIEESIELYWD